MTEWRINKRGTFFGFQDGRIVREDFASKEKIISAVTDGGLPVPILFGTRFLAPTVVAWTAPEEPQATRFYLRESFPSTGQLWDTEPQFNDTDLRRNELIVKMYLASVVMVLCAGRLDAISRFVVDQLPVIINERALPSTYATDDAQAYVEYVPRSGWTNSTRLVVSRADASVFEGSAGGLGLPDPRSPFTSESKYSEFFLNKGEKRTKIANSRPLDRGTRALGVSSFVFDSFNFGGVAPLKNWRVAVSRIETQTARTRSGQGAEAVYKPQWQPDLAKISPLQFSGQNTYYLIVVDRTLGASYLSALKDYVMGLPFDSSNEKTTQYRLIEMSYQDCAAVKSRAYVAYRMTQFSWRKMAFNPETNRSKNRTEYEFGEYPVVHVRSGYLGRPYWNRVTMRVPQANFKGCAFATQRQVDIVERPNEISSFYEDLWVKGENKRTSTWANFGSKEVTDYPIQRAITFELDVAFNFRARIPTGTDPEFSIGIRSFNLTNDRDLLSRHFDDQIAKARRERIGVYSHCKMVSEDDGKFILQTCASDLNSLTRGGTDIRYSSLVIFGMTNVFGTTGPEPFLRGRSNIEDSRGDRLPLGRSYIENLVINRVPATPTFAESPTLYNQLPSDDNTSRNFREARRQGFQFYRTRPLLYEYVGMSDAPLFPSMYSFLKEFVRDWIAKITGPVAFPTPDNAPGSYQPPLRDFHITALQNNQPEVRVFLWEYNINSVKSNRRLQFNVVSHLPDAGYLTELDSSSSPIKMPLGAQKPVSEVLSEISTLQPLGHTMNPVHALRECLVDPDWGDAIPEELIDETTFSYAARVCKNEGLDFCYVHDDLAGVDKLVTDISDYIEGVVYYEAAIDKMVLRLLRDDYNINSIPAFNETNISQILNYRLLFANDRTNSLTVRFHDAARGTPGSFTVHDVEAATRTGVSSVILNYDGCATATAAEKVAVRELNALSRQLVAFTAVVDPPENHIIGLGEPLVFSYRDLGIERIVMRVSSIDYGDGTTGGITLELIQDAYSGIQRYDPLVEQDPDIPIEPPVQVDPFANIIFSEAGWPRYDAPSTIIPTLDIATIATTQRYLQAGVRYDPDAQSSDQVTIGDQIVPHCVGTLLTPIGELDGDPRAQSFVIQVRTGPLAGTTSFAGIRIDDEFFLLQREEIIREPDSDIAQLIITERAVADSVAKAHEVGADVWYLQYSWMDQNTFSDGSYSIVSERNTLISRRIVRPDIGNTLVGRLARPFPPYFVTVNNCWSSDLRLGGHIQYRLLPKVVTPWNTRIADVLTTLSYDGSVIMSHRTTPRAGQELVATFDGRTIKTKLDAIVGSDPLPTYPLVLSVYSEYNEIKSWQSWDFNIEWSVNPPPRSGWNRNWGNHWGSGDEEGWNYQWDQSFGD